MHLLGKSFTVKCPEDKQADLQAAAEYLTENVQNLRLAAKSGELEQLLALAALNITYELVSLRQQTQAQSTELAERLQALQQAVSTA
jgi:cell division protein ZapA